MICNEKTCQKCERRLPISAYRTPTSRHCAECRRASDLESARKYAAKSRIHKKLDEGWKAENRRRTREYNAKMAARPTIDVPEFKKCTRCCYVKPSAEFKKNRTRKDGLQNMCLECHRDNKYGFLPGEYDELVLAQGGKCKICGNENPDGARLHVDHCHETGRIRALLCRTCNVGIGQLNDDPQLVKRAYEYLASFLQ